jgi:diadenosine tetraphosphate (Ap4A) HIT family hydrolase
MDIIWQNEILYITQEPNELPWLKIYLKSEKKELTDCATSEQEAIFKTALIIEQALREYYSPSKINHASFGNMLPKVHWHIQARFENDAFFPQPLWGAKERTSTLSLPSFDGFVKILLKRLNER